MNFNNDDKKKEEKSEVKKIHDPNEAPVIEVRMDGKVIRARKAVMYLSDIEGIEGSQTLVQGCISLDEMAFVQYVIGEALQKAGVDLVKANPMAMLEVMAKMAKKKAKNSEPGNTDIKNKLMGLENLLGEDFKM